MPAYVYNPNADFMPVFTNIVNKAEQQNRMLDNTQKSVLWLRKEATKVTDKPQQILRQAPKDRQTRPTQLEIGEMFLYNYDAKHKATLPYWDQFPLVIPFDVARTKGRAVKGGAFMGLNFHYLHPRQRALLMDQLYQFKKIDSITQEERLAFTWRTLSSISTTPYFKPCVKQYLTSHVNRNMFVRIDPSEWEMALFLPIQRFQSQGRDINPNKVWNDSLKAARKRP